MLQVNNELDTVAKPEDIAIDAIDRTMHEIGLKGVLKHDEPMAHHTTWRVGGNADHYFEPADLDDLCLYLSNLPADESIIWLGLGSNLLVRDGGIRGTVVTVAGVLNELEFLQPDRIRVGAGAPCAKLARFCAKSGLAGAEFFAGIPGTMGGALAMNAGAFDRETWDIVTSVDLINRSGQRMVRIRENFEIGYRHVQIEKDEWFIAAELQLDIDPSQQAEKRIRELLAKRSSTQPMGKASCGSVFRNPAGDYAARLIESCGLKDKRIGQACVSDKHANFIINMGGATAADIEQLILHIKDAVKQEHAVELTPEVRIVGEA